MQKSIEIGYDGDGVNIYRFTCCKGTLQSRTGLFKFCPFCGHPVSMFVQTTTDFEKSRRKSYRPYIDSKNNAPGYSFYLLGVYQRTFYGSIQDAAKILKFLRDGCVFRIPLWVTEADDLEEWNKEDDLPHWKKIGRLLDEDSDTETLWSVKISHRASNFSDLGKEKPPCSNMEKAKCTVI